MNKMVDHSFHKIISKAMHTLGYLFDLIFNLNTGSTVLINQREPVDFLANPRVDWKLQVIVNRADSSKAG